MASRNLVIPKKAYAYYAPGMPITGYYECPKCGHSATKMWWCKYCEKPMVKKFPHDSSMAIFHINEKIEPAKITREVIIG